MLFRRYLFAALGVAGTALGLQFASGRVSAVFYAQMGAAGWLGVAAGSIFFALITGILCACSRYVFSGFIRFLYGMILCALFCMLAGEAGHMGALTLPVRHSFFFALALAVLLAAALALTGQGAVLILSAIHAVSLCVFLALLLFAPEYAPDLRYGLDLRLENCVPVALLLSLVHASVSGCLTAGIVRSCRARPAMLGAFSGAVYALVLALGNGVLARSAPILLRLNAPFAALAAGWGRGGFYLSAMMVFQGSVTSLSAILHTCVSQRKSRFFGDN